MIISSKTDVGTTRSNNEDYFQVGEFSDGTVWAVVCDGMGGTNGGNIASESAVKMITDKFSRSYHVGMNDNSIRNLILTSIEAANITVFSKALKDSSLSGMGTTVVIAMVRDNTLHFASVGDSRLYIVNNNTINQMTTDHSIVQMMIDSGEITPQEAKDHPQKNVITRALGVSERVKIDFYQEDISSDDIVLLCTDGLSNFVEDSKINELCINNDKYLLADILVDEANKNGGGDNITVVTITDC